jgi:hypothetical protein
MPQTYKKAFGLRDNPFSPKQQFPGVRSQVLMKSIFVNPIRLDDDDGLYPLYVGGAGPFAAHYGEYEEKLAGENYLEDSGDGVPSVGNNTFVFIVRGPKGTGKTTLMNLMLRHLKRCKPPESEWVPFKAQFGNSLSEVDQSKALDDVKNLIMGKSPDYCYLILDNLVDGVSQKAFDLYQEFEDRRQFIMFITTHDAKMRERTWENWGIPIIPYQTSELSPDNAVAFIRSRVQLFRDDKTKHFFEGNELFPFNEKNIREAVETKSVAYDPTAKLITIRQFSQSLSIILEKQMPHAPDLYDAPGDDPPAVAAKLGGCEINLSESSREIIERVAA